MSEILDHERQILCAEHFNRCQSNSRKREFEHENLRDMFLLSRVHTNEQTGAHMDRDMEGR